MSEELQTRFPLEAYKQMIEHTKHISTMCTGSILIIVTLLEKVFVAPKWRASIAISLIAFLVSIVASVAAQVGVIESIDHEDKVADWADTVGAFGLLGMYVFFLIGLSSLLAFALRNLY